MIVYQNLNNAFIFDQLSLCTKNIRIQFNLNLVIKIYYYI